ncbi:N-acetylmuramate alpha-1-phosphate uridylyltransferase MurU [Pseudoteredinibacter isoporae]|uniref:MurNAc alpha-1-phosphate uridylyltransferase n=1 Tax=Pseudoteredinibacter isoporae TaxID=570281 RepID=A0A7X0JRX6_9GAMM|nr:nucleotidyltransferase family protein [Pseudoteredinibacter isoporae]MBB6521172.1 MurNAc alpha-1-phosphate uridylyltransferase [Pseudoteredinibacter isoporae]
MKAMILAAGKGTRMQPLTLHTPKPLLEAGGKSLIEHQLDRIKSAGIHEVIINIAYLGEQIREHLGDGSAYGLRIHYSVEPEPLETAGAIAHALPLLGDEPFLLLNGDVWCEFPLEQLCQHPLNGSSGRLLLVNNPAFKTHGDFSIDQNQLLGMLELGEGYTYAGIALLLPALVADYPNKRKIFALREVFDAAIAQGQLSAEVYRGDWRDIGTVERLQELRDDLS